MQTKYVIILYHKMPFRKRTTRRKYGGARKSRRRSEKREKRGGDRRDKSRKRYSYPTIHNINGSLKMW